MASPTDPTVARIEVLPPERVLGRDSQQQLIVLAHYTDGSTEDVTRCTTFDSNDAEMATVDVRGLVTTRKLPGSVAIMARYQGKWACSAPPSRWACRSRTCRHAKTFIDELVFAKLKSLGLPPSPLANDATFLRRVTIDVAGRLPTLEETQQFLADADPHKRGRWIDRLLDRPDYADYFANKWSAILRNKRRAEARQGRHVRVPRLAAMQPARQQALRPIGSRTAGGHRRAGQASAGGVVPRGRRDDGSGRRHGPAVPGPADPCARCHHHPFEKWSQQDYYGFQAFFAQVGRKKGEATGLDRIFHRRGVAQARHPKTGAAAQADRPGQRSRWTSGRTRTRGSGWSTGWPAATTRSSPAPW